MRGSFADGARFVVQPYMEYRNPKDLEIFDRCATGRRTPVGRYDKTRKVKWLQALRG
jgi:hypothetical protein